MYDAKGCRIRQTSTGRIYELGLVGWRVGGSVGRVGRMAGWRFGGLVSWRVGGVVKWPQGTPRYLAHYDNLGVIRVGDNEDTNRLYQQTSDDKPLLTPTELAAVVGEANRECTGGRRWMRMFDGGCSMVDGRTALAVHD